VIWIDPVETVGWATAEVDHPCDEGLPRTLDVLDYGNMRMKRFCLALLDGAYKYDVIGFETYTIRADRLRLHAGSTVPTLQCVGGIRTATWAAQRQRPTIKLLEQEPNAQSRGRGAAKLHFSPEVLEAISWADANKHDEGHYASALLHLAAWYHDYQKGTA
jgi:hypothetical protein